MHDADAEKASASFGGVFDQLRCYLTHRIGVVRRTPAGSGQNAP